MLKQFERRAAARMDLMVLSLVSVLSAGRAGVAVQQRSCGGCREETNDVIKK
jgi:hypothetical protein